MIYVKINENLYPATISGRVTDKDWNNRASKTITLEMDYTAAVSLFVDGLVWSIIRQEEVPTYEQNENGELIQTGTEIKETEWNNSEYDIAGSITDNRNGTLSIKMGKITDTEALAELMEALS